MLKFLEKARNCNSWFSLGEHVVTVVWWLICKSILISIGGVIIMPWYSNVGFVFISFGLLMICYDLYKSYIQTTLSFNKAVDIAKIHLKNHVAINTSSLDAIFWNDNSGYSTETKNIMLLIFKACRENKLSLLGKEGFCSEKEIPYWDIDLDKIRFSKDGYPEIYDYSHNLMFTNLSLEKGKFFKWLKVLSKI